jgi:uncharacterized protein YeaO (DUF488 family)
MSPDYSSAVGPEYLYTITGRKQLIVPMNIRLKRVYDPPSQEDGFRILVERLWPRGISKEKAKIDLWLKDAGASTALRVWFGHDPEKWDEFRERYFHEIRGKSEIIQELVEITQQRPVVTFVFGARDTEHNNAKALKEFFEVFSKEQTSRLTEKTKH